MDISGIDYVGLRRVIERGTAEIIEENDDCMFLHDEVSGAYMLACDDDDMAMAVLDKYKDRKYDLLTTTNKKAAEYACASYGLQNIMECYQYAYLGDMPEQDPRISIRNAEMDDLPVIMEVYDQVSDEEMAKDIRRGAVIMAYSGDHLVGFIGEHLEGSQGMLYVYPEYRRKGYAAALENACFARTISKGWIPFGQVETNNTASVRLQEKRGLARADRLIYWAW